MLYVGAVALLGAAALTAAFVASGPPQQTTWLAWLVVMTLLVSVGPPQVVGRIQLFSSGLFTIAAVPLVGPVGTAIVSVVPVLAARNEPIKRVYNTSIRILYGLAGGAAYALAGGVTLGTTPLPDAAVLALAGRMALAAVVIATVNIVMLAGIVRVTSGASLRAVVPDLGRTIVPGYSAYLVAAFLLTVLWAPVGLGAFAALMGLPCLAVAQWALRQYVAEHETRQSVLAAVLNALDVRLPGTREQGEQVARVAEQMARVLGLAPRDVETLTTAARLRDIGLLSLPIAELDPGRPLGALDGPLREHPRAARQVLGELGFLADALDIIEAHHERVDGSGYPRGLRDAQIPMGSRVLAVADAYVNLVLPIGAHPALTPEAAVAACLDAHGHLDPAVVRALQVAIERGMPPLAGAETAGSAGRAAVPGAAVDHAHPDSPRTVPR